MIHVTHKTKPVLVAIACDNCACLADRTGVGDLATAERIATARRFISMPGDKAVIDYCETCAVELGFSLGGRQ